MKSLLRIDTSQMHNFWPSIATRFNQVAASQNNTANAIEKRRRAGMLDWNLDGHARIAR